MERPKRTIKKPKQLYEPDPDVQLDGNESVDSDFDLDGSSGEDILTSDEEESGDEEYVGKAKKDEYEKDDFLVSDSESLIEISGSDSEGSWVDSDEEMTEEMTASASGEDGPEEDVPSEEELL